MSSPNIKPPNHFTSALSLLPRRSASNPKATCHNITEYFFAEHKPDSADSKGEITSQLPIIDIVRPANGLELALDPRIPTDQQAFALTVKGLTPNDEVEWILNDQSIAKVKQHSYLWNVVRGSHTLKAIIWRDTQKHFETKSYKFLVK
jgi:penicillin-binding protein 1C